ncbi:hypothetical protein TMatcc_001152 [Talaromyces marneffei ATCC 18224]|uniref:Uncharacterized protein n=2 Tax=Talaromyces marneffei TaxID=37727 RepID=B6QPD1_TALMQ|nr:uncharacterized protein EYB26_003692 [Talaromyces marneffei]EEA21150.1 conserved hypothetical protein [Talaromyces marneffei ATCC 18224]KAE8550080.1 hypothetical protein EYB25_008611 [Talaromyces marneffei]QGA16025.1 hypothetical protein EYB26_003692 [Talaromyces marneffei]
MASFPDYDTPFRMRTQLFRPPHTPSSTSSIYHTPDTETTRKRMRREAPDVRTLAWDPMSSTELEGPSPLSLINTDYILANGGEDHRQLDLKDSKEKLAEEQDYRPNRYRYNSLITDQQPALTIGNKDVGSRKRSHSEATEMATQPTQASTPTTPGWGRTVFTVVGRVWDFCWTNAFRGFAAGGGNSYQVGTPVSKEASHRQSDLQHDPFTSGGGSTLIPGQYPDEDTEHLRDKESWVLVQDSPSLKFSSARSPSPTQFSRKVPRRSAAHRPQSRRSLVNPLRPVTKRPTLNPLQPATVTPSSLTGRPSTPLKQPLSPTRASLPGSPASREAQRFAAQVRRREREEDASIQKMNDQLKALIREGREALGSRVEVDDMDFDD